MFGGDKMHSNTFVRDSLDFIVEIKYETNMQNGFVRVMLITRQFDRHVMKWHMMELIEWELAKQRGYLQTY